MKKYLSTLTFLLLLLLLPAESGAAKILYYVDTVAIGQDSMANALVNLSAEHEVVTASNIGEFEADIANNSFDLVILMLHDALRTTSDFPQFVNYVQNAGKIIFADVHKDTSLAALTGVSYIGNINMSPVNVTDVNVSDGIAMNPMPLINPGYTVWSMPMAPGIRTLASFTETEAAAIMTSDTITVNGFLVDTPANLTDGTAFFENQIEYVLSPPMIDDTIAVPLSPSAKLMLILLFGLAGYTVMRKRVQKRHV